MAHLHCQMCSLRETCFAGFGSSLMRCEITMPRGGVPLPSGVVMQHGIYPSYMKLQEVSLAILIFSMQRSEG